MFKSQPQLFLDVMQLCNNKNIPNINATLITPFEIAFIFCFTNFLNDNFVKLVNLLFRSIENINRSIRLGIGPYNPLHTAYTIFYGRRP